MATRAKDMNNIHAERLNEKAPRTGDAIVRSHTNMKYEKSAEMTDFNYLTSSLGIEVKQLITNRKLEDFWVSDVTFDANADNSNNVGLTN
jgi:hypothetical protein